jgi:hypothetical protein
MIRQQHHLLVGGMRWEGGDGWCWKSCCLKAFVGMPHLVVEKGIHIKYHQPWEQDNVFEQANGAMATPPLLLYLQRLWVQEADIVHTKPMAYIDVDEKDIN